MGCIGWWLGAMQQEQEPDHKLLCTSSTSSPTSSSISSSSSTSTSTSTYAAGGGARPQKFLDVILKNSLCNVWAPELHSYLMIRTV